ncbi:HaeII family restriction endonuclease [bacterium]|nr:HaeII family restriction endonuclease [bacterium]
MNKNLLFCKTQIEKMLQRSQSKIIFPLITLGLIKNYKKNKNDIFSDKDIKEVYYSAVRDMKIYLGHDLHIGGKYYDAYPSRNLPKYSVLKVLGKKKYQLLSPFKDEAEKLSIWIPKRIEAYISNKVTVIPKLAKREFRVKISSSLQEFKRIIKNNIDINPINFEIFSFAIIKVHLEKFACKVYRDTRTSAYDKGVDISTNFGVVYQIKKLKVINKRIADNIYAELKTNFDNERLEDGKVIIIIDNISKSIKNYLIDMKVQSISKNDLLRLIDQIEDAEDREKVLRIIYEEFRREYASDI